MFLLRVLGWLALFALVSAAYSFVDSVWSFLLVTGGLLAAWWAWGRWKGG